MCLIRYFIILSFSAIAVLFQSVAFADLKPSRNFVEDLAKYSDPRYHAGTTEEPSFSIQSRYRDENYTIRHNMALIVWEDGVVYAAPMTEVDHAYLHVRQHAASWVSVEPFDTSARAGNNPVELMSFESAAYRNYFLRHQGFQLKVSEPSDSSLFRKDATFKPIDPLTGECQSKECGWRDPFSIEAVNYPDHFIVVDNQKIGGTGKTKNFLRVKLQKNDGSDDFAKRARFFFGITYGGPLSSKVVPPFAKRDVEKTSETQLDTYVLSLDQVDVADTSDAGEDEIYISVNIDGAGFKRWGEKRQMNEESELRYWYPGLYWEFKDSIIVEIWDEDDEEDEDENDRISREVFYASSPNRSGYTAAYGKDVFDEDAAYSVTYSKYPAVVDKSKRINTLVIEDVTALSVASGIDLTTWDAIEKTTGHWADSEEWLIANRAVYVAGEFVEPIGTAVDIANNVAAIVRIIDEASESPDQLYIEYQGRQLWPEDEAFVEVNEGETHHLGMALTGVGSGKFEFFEEDEGPATEDTLGQLFYNPIVPPLVNDPATHLIQGVPDEGSLYLMRSRLYKAAPKEFCQSYGGNQIVLRNNQRFVHYFAEPARANAPATTSSRMISFAGTAYPSALWVVRCQPGGTVGFTSVLDHNHWLGDDIGVKFWTPLRLAGTDQWVFRKEEEKKSPAQIWSQYSPKREYLNSLDGLSPLSLKNEINGSARFQIHEPKKFDPNAPTKKALAINAPGLDVCIVPDAEIDDINKDKFSTTGSKHPCPDGGPNWILERADSSKYLFAYRLRANLPGQVQLYLEADGGVVRLSECNNKENESSCIWYLDRSWSTTKPSYYIRSALEHYNALQIQPETTSYYDEDGVYYEGLPFSMSTLLRPCERNDNIPGCQWQFVIE